MGHCLSGDAAAAPIPALIHGFDLVFVPQFRIQLQQPGTTMGRVFTDREWAQAQRRTDVLVSLAARWAAKEAFVKAWSSSFMGTPSPISADDFIWSEVEVLSDHYHRPYFNFRNSVSEFLARGPQWHWALSLSHDGDYAAASVIGSLSTTKSNGGTGS